ncbi:MAG: response regulator [Prosthecobacter sp.]|jgi:signal transduction histidine kinase/ActR/RegA family two-component response regulator|uniref:hybrid sensor histidine kinase/response regulator n=1 Tax=Prosthecobacter sp. TaxID=1965333 RepID=UPI0019F100CD|nr:ATP-binding protein [Prosthecobacter sp.]MBE2287232.1 response regulator [Prosthecobacter sp.]
MTTAPLASNSSPASVAEMEQSLEQLKVANYYLRVALDQVTDGVVIVESEPSDPKCGPKVLFSNAAAAMLAGADPETGLRGLGLNDLVAGDKDATTLQASLQQAVQNGGCHECECALQSLRTQAPIPCKWRVRAVFNSLRKLLNFTILISPAQPNAPAKADPKPAVEDLDAQSVQLRKENLAALAQGIAHDVNNLLGPVTVRLSALIQQVQEHPALAHELQAVFAGLKRAKQFTSQVVTASKAVPRKHEPTDLSALMRDTVEFAGAGSNVHVCVRQDDNLRLALADPVKLSQVLQNLVMNGIQAMPRGGYMDVEAHNHMVGGTGDGRLKPGPHVLLVVRDRGCGIARENLGRLFRESFTTKADGNGIGLTTCKRFIDEMGGEIRVTSTPNVGTEFRVYLPAAEGSGSTKPLSPADAAPVPLKHGKGKVLIVDDEDDLRKVANMILTRCGYEVVQCDNGQDAVKIYQSLFRTGTPPDVVLMDLTLRGGMNGTETAAEILHLDPEARIVCTSGSVTQEVQMVFLERGFVGVLPKPYEAGELTQTVHRVATMMKRN